MQALWVAIDADRPVLPGMTMSSFSMQPLVTEAARRLKVVNHDILLEYVRSTAAGAVVLTDADWRRLRRGGGYSGASRGDSLSAALAENYEMAFSTRAFSQQTGIYVYLPRARNAVTG